MANFSIEGRLKGLKDIERNWLFELVIPDANKLTGGIASDEDLIIRCKTAVIPGRGLDTVESNFAGMKQLFPMKPTFSNSFSVEMEETEDQKITKSLYAWRQLMFDVDPGSAKAGVSSYATKRDACKDIFLLVYKYDGSIMEKKYKFVNAFPSGVEDVAMGYASNEAVKYSVTFSYDYWLLV
jgi:hypothetical protein